MLRSTLQLSLACAHCRLLSIVLSMPCLIKTSMCCFRMTSNTSFEFQALPVALMSVHAALERNAAPVAVVVVSQQSLQFVHPSLE